MAKKVVKKEAKIVEKQSAITTILLIVIGALIGFAIGYALFRFKVLGA